jgi:polyhydroxyalkanoate synthesis regulator phasin
MRTLRERILKIKSISYNQAEQLIYEWVKKGCITLKEFCILNQINKDTIYSN